MPSASVKSDTTGSSDNQDPLGKVYLVIEKKIRNLEKRKNKLENYKSELSNGKVLNEDQQKAVDAYDTVIASLELSREFACQINNVISENAKLAKLQQKKIQEEKIQNEVDRIKQVFKVQDVLTRLREDDVRADFLAGTNGAVHVEELKLQHLDEIYKLVTLPTGFERDKTPAGFKTQLSTAAENMLNLLDGRSKTSPEGPSFRDMRSLIYQIANCTYPKVVKPVVKASSTPSPDNESESQQSSSKPKKSKVKASAIPNGTSDKVISSSSGSTKTSNKSNSRTIASSTANIATSTAPLVTPASSQPPTSARVNAPSSKSLSTTVSSSFTVASSNIGVTASNKAKRREASHAAERPPPGMTNSALSEPSNHDLITSLPQDRAAELAAAAAAAAAVVSPMGPAAHSASAAAASLPLEPHHSHPHTYYSPSKGTSRVSMDINDLVTAEGFNFLQESQVGPDPAQSAAAVYVDPAVVSFGSIKPESLVQLHEQQQKQQRSVQHQQQQQQTVPPPILAPTDMGAQSVGPIRTETFINQTFSSCGTPAGFSQAVPVYSSPSGTANLPAPIPMPPQEKPSFESSSWAAQEDGDGWGAPDPSPPSGPPNENDAGSWGAVDNNESGWGDDEDTKPHSNMNMDVGDDRRVSGFRGGRGIRGGGLNRGISNSGGFRGGRGYFSYTRGGGGFGGNGYVGRGNRGGPSSNGGGFRGRGTFSRGGRGIDSLRGGIRNRGGYQGNSQGPRNQY